MGKQMKLSDNLALIKFWSPKAGLDNKIFSQIED